MRPEDHRGTPPYRAVGLHMIPISEHPRAVRGRAGIDASLIANTSTGRVVAKTEPDGDVAVGLFNKTTRPEVISTTASAIGLPASGHYRLANLWTHKISGSGATISAKVPPHGVVLYQVKPAR
jgi:Alpha galactosidase C-terminal beta sandwich domain